MTAGGPVEHAPIPPALTWVTAISTAVVAAGCVAVSYAHAHDVAVRAGMEDPLAIVYPACIDALGVAGSARLVADQRAGRRPLPSAVIAAVLGLAASLAANLVAVDPTLVSDQWVRLVVAGYPPVGLFIIGHLALEAFGGGRPDARPATGEPTDTRAGPSARATTRPEKRALDAPAHERALPERVQPRALTPDAPARPLDATPRPAERAPMATEPSASDAPETRPVLDATLIERAERVRDSLTAEGVALSDRKLTEGLRADEYEGGVSRDTVKALRAALDARSHAATNGKAAHP